ncbi:hypothetical protein ACQPZF_09850 [Actinosynnema sp. CS-041913]|uniref:hypothetical protein n=1 Tax=Actinosynnema sp. CS-041913 TaxID=3239917 RepID=UPI003D8C22DF
MTPEDEAMLIAGPRRVAEVAVTALVGAGALRFTGDGLVHAVHTSGAATQAQAHALGVARQPAPLGALVEAVAARVPVEPFIERGLLVAPGRWRALTPVFWLGNVAAVGVLAAAAFGLLPSMVLPALVACVAVAGVAGYLRGPFAGSARSLPPTLRRTPLDSVPPLNRVARAGLRGGVTPVGEALGLPGAALATLPPPERGKVGGWWKGWVSASAGGRRSI